MNNPDPKLVEEFVKELNIVLNRFGLTAEYLSKEWDGLDDGIVIKDSSGEHVKYDELVDQFKIINSSPDDDMGYADDLAMIACLIEDYIVQNSVVLGTAAVLPNDKIEEASKLIFDTRDQLHNKIIEKIKGYTDIETFIYNIIPRNGLKLDDAEKLEFANSLNVIFSTDVIDHKECDDVLARSEFLALLAGSGNKSLALFSNVEFNSMAKKMEKWGLDASNHWEKTMIEGLIKVDKDLLEQKKLMQENASKLSIQFDKASNADPISSMDETVKNSSSLSKEDLLEERACNEALEQLKRINVDVSDDMYDPLLEVLTSRRLDALKLEQRQEEKRDSIIKAREAQIDAVFKDVKDFAKNVVNKVEEKFELK